MAWVRKVCSLMFIGLLGLSACGPGRQPDVASLKIGVVGPFEGELAALGASMRDGVLLATEQWNAAGGLLGQPIELVVKDSACDYQRGRAAAQEAIDEGVAFIIGALCADASEGVAQVVSQAGVLQITPGSVNLDLTLDAEGEVRPLVFRMPFVDNDQGTVAARFALNDLGATTAGMLYAEESVYGSALAGAFQAAFEAGGGDVVAVETYDQDSLLFYEELEEMREANPDVLYFPGYHDVANRLVTQARSFGLLQPVLGSDGWDSPDLDIAAARSLYLTTHFFAAEPRTQVRTWVDAFEARFQRVPDALAALSYDAADLLFSAIDETGLADPAFVAETLMTIEFDGVTGPCTFDAVHNPIKPVTVLRFEGGQFLFEGRFSPADGEEP